MRTTVDLPEEELEELMRVTGARTKREAIRRAIDELSRRNRLARLAERFGSFENLVTQQELAELREQG